MVKINCPEHGVTNCSDVIRKAKKDEKRKNEYVRGVACEKCFAEGKFRTKWKLEAPEQLNKQEG